MNIKTVTQARTRLASVITLDFVVAFALAFVVVFAVLRAFG